MSSHDRQQQDSLQAEELIQERLEQLEDGVPLEACLSDLRDEEAELLELVVALRDAPQPARDPGAAAAQRTQFLRQMGRAYSKRYQAPRAEEKRGLRSLWDRLQPRTAFAGALAVLAVCALIAFVVAAALRGTPGDGDVAEIPLPDATAEERIAEHLRPEPALAPIFEAFVPLVSAVIAPDPVHAVLREPRGLVEMSASDGTWQAAVAGRRIAEGQRVRTGGLSSVVMAFHDGSQVRLGPNTEVAVEKLDARVSDGPRIVALTQLSGETDHRVIVANLPGSRYDVQTPSASGAAKGTAFHVQVAPDLLTRFSVGEGVVAVTGENVTVDVFAGQSTVVNTGQAPAEPAFRISGEGEVSQIGSTWVIGGQTFETHDGTAIVGNPQVGDWVFVEGRLLPDGSRIADRIVLLRRSPLNRFTITGRVEAIGDAKWTVAGQTILVDEKTAIDGDIESGNLVRVEGVILDDGALLADQIRLLEELPGLPFSFTGVVQEIGDETWKISGVIITVDEETDIDEGLGVGDIVEVHGWILESGSWLARTIEHAEELERGFELTGVVESIDPWTVAGISFETREWTEIEPGIEVGDLVRVEGRILEDGTWAASEITQLDEEKRVLRIVFVGTVENMDPWVVSGIPLVVNDQTFIEGDIAVGNLVKVTVSILPDGTWLATRIELLDTEDGKLDCVYITAVVMGIGPGWIELPNWPRIVLDGVIVENEIRVGSVILMLVCVNEDGSIEIVHIVVIYEPGPVIPPMPVPPSPPGEHDKVTICHKPNGKNPHTITISRSALQAHLNHGDTIGACK